MPGADSSAAGGSNTKPRVGVMLRQSMSSTKSPNHCNELEALRERYKTMCQDMKSLKTALKQRHAALVQTSKSQAAMAQAMLVMTQESPLSEPSMGSMGAMDEVARKTQDRADRFQLFALDYFDQWNEATTTRINADLKQTDQLRRDADHYEAKVESLEQNVKKFKDKSKPVPEDTMDKLQRNKEKLREANTAYKHSVQDTYLVLDELVDRAWRDLHPLLLKLLIFDNDVNRDQREATDDHQSALDELKQLRQKHNIPTNRLDDFEAAKPQQLNTASGAQRKQLAKPAAQDPRTSNSKPAGSQLPPPPRKRSKSPWRKASKSDDDDDAPPKRGKSPWRKSKSDGDDDAASPKKSKPRSKSPWRKASPNDGKEDDDTDATPKQRGRSNSNRNSNNSNPNSSNSNNSSNPNNRYAPPTSSTRQQSAPPPSNSSNNRAMQPYSPQQQQQQRAKPSPSSNGSRKAPAPAASPRSSNNGSSKKPDIGPRPDRTAGKGGKVASSSPGAGGANHHTPPDPWADADPSKWKYSEQQFSGSFQFETKGKTEEEIAPIQKGIKKFRSDPDKYLIMFYQSNMVNWPKDQQRYMLIHREGSVGYKPTGISPNGPMTVLTQYYERLPPLPNNELPNKHRDQYTDSMVHQRKKLHSAKNKPILPGRGMGVGDTPNLKIIGDVDPSDIHQGSVGDCWLLSGISSLAEFDGAIKHCYRKTKNLDQRPLDGPNQYIITLWDLPTWTERDIIVDERLPVMADGSGQLLASRPSEDGELWVCYLEKALAAHCGGWDKITGGQCTHAWALLTGCKEQYTIRVNPKTGLFACYAKYDPNSGQWGKLANSPHDGEQSMWQNAWPKVGGGGSAEKECTQEELFMKMCAWDDTNYIVGAGCSDKSGDAGLVDNHAYSVIECHNDVAGTDIDLIKVRNPWGKGEIEDGMFDDDGPGWDQYPQIKAALNPVVADDGIFWVTKQEFFEFFATIYLSASDMTEFLED